MLVQPAPRLAPPELLAPRDRQDSPASLETQGAREQLVTQVQRGRLASQGLQELPDPLGPPLGLPA